MPRIKEGFKGERIVVLPGFLIEELKRDPLGRELYITDIGYYPHAGFHYCERKEEDSNEFVLRGRDGSNWTVSAMTLGLTSFSFCPNIRHMLMAVRLRILGRFTGFISMAQKPPFSVWVSVSRMIFHRPSIPASRKG